MKVTLEFGDTGKEADVEMPDLPRIGEEVLWTVLDGAADDAGPYEHMRQYRVRMVDWAMSPDAATFVIVRLDLLEDVSGAPRPAPGS